MKTTNITYALCASAAGAGLLLLTILLGFVLGERASLIVTLGGILSIGLLGSGVSIACKVLREEETK